MVKEFAMRISKQKNRKAYTLVEMLMVIIISITFITTFNSVQTIHSFHHIDAQIFSMMMKTISHHQSQDIVLDNVVINRYHPQFSFSRSYTYHFDRYQVVFHIGRGYYAIQKRN